MWPDPDQATLDGSSCTSIMTCSGGCGYTFLVLLMMGAVTPRTCSDFAVNKYLHTVASGWIFINTKLASLYLFFVSQRE